jgi:hypothetical protein
MSLAEAVLEIAKDIEEESDRYDGSYRRALEQYAKQLRCVVKASADSKPNQVADGGFTIPYSMKEALKLEEVQRKQLMRRGEAEEAISGGMVLCEGGSEDGTSVPVPDSIPNEAKILLGREVYIFYSKDRVFRYSKEETDKLPKS